MIIKAFLCFLISMLGQSENKFFGNSMLNRPIVVASLTGLVFGDFAQGCIIAGTLEFTWMGIMYINVSTPADVCTGSIVGTALAMMSNSGVEVAMAIAIPVGLLASYIETGVNVFNIFLLHRADAYAINGEIDKINHVHIAMGLIKMLAMSLVVFIAVMLGSNVIQSIVDAIPQEIMNGMSVASNILPALGFAMLMNIMWDKKYVPFFFIGFVLYTYLGMSVTGVTVLAICIAVYKYFKEEVIQ